MRINVKQDLIGGTCVLVVGLIAAIHTVTSYDIGTPASMGPGFFPLSLGILLVFFGFSICIAGWRSNSVDVVFEFQPFLAICLAIAAFALILPTFGLLPAVCILVVVSLMAQKLPGILKTTAITVSIMIVAFLIFRIGLNIPLPILIWPF